MTDFEQIHQLKISLIEKGWDIEEKYSNDGFGKLVGYHIFARRCDWHGKPMLLQVISSVSVKYAKQSQKAGHCLTPFRNYMTNAPGHG